MNINEFAEKVKIAVGQKLGSQYSVERKEVLKNNGVLLHGIQILSEKSNVVPVVYLEHFWEEYERGVTFGEVVERLLDVCGKELPLTRMDMDFFKGFGKVRDRVCCRLVGRAGNEELLKDIPHVEFLDLAVCFFYSYRTEKIGEASILIHNSHMEMWQCGTAELMKLAQRNTQVLYPWKCVTMEEIMREIYADGQERPVVGEVPMRVLTNRQKVNGAACLIYPGVLELLAERYEADLYILPSSVHEVILLEDSGQESPEELKNMVIQVNRTQVAAEEVLSDSLYSYDRKKKCVEKLL